MFKLHKDTKQVTSAYLGRYTSVRPLALFFCTVAAVCVCVFLVSSLPMHNVSRTVPPPLRIRSMSMVDYDLPACQRAAASAAVAAAVGTGGKSGPPSPVLSATSGDNTPASTAPAAAAAGK